MWYLIDKGEHTALYKMNKNAYIKPKKLHKYCIPRTPNPCTHAHRRNITGMRENWGMGGGGGIRANRIKSFVVVLFADINF